MFEKDTLGHMLRHGLAASDLPADVLTCFVAGKKDTPLMVVGVSFSPAKNKKPGKPTD
jgi:hypothetical protein